MIKTIEWTDEGVVMIDQRRLPAEELYPVFKTHEEVARAIEDMVVRGAPAIGVAAAMGVAIGLKNSEATSAEDVRADFENICDRIARTRPTAVNLFWGVERMRWTFNQALLEKAPVEEIKRRLIEEARAVHREDIESNQRMGRFGAELIPDSATVLTHCNAGALATAGFGTALGVIRAAVEAGKRVQVFADETRPFLQGSRLTAWELARDRIPVTLITDGMSGHFMKAGKVDCVVVGADRIAANGDVANKIGTYMVAIAAHENNIPFYVAAPLSTVDLLMNSGEEIPIENRADAEVTHFHGSQVAPDGISVANPAFDVTPHRYVSAIITDVGVAREPYDTSLKALFEKR
ncbi:MAG TPA: S-methyl-5-thioribose-1-phosphate isomerase [Blastocatellia bacterium]|jgi:methylthioribose-1-phosphate isomerase|nr:S-methyl-5-thioribose-1-phosphate isomerase [Blastocatellia bacterium]